MSSDMLECYETVTLDKGQCNTSSKNFGSIWGTIQTFLWREWQKSGSWSLGQEWHPVSSRIPTKFAGNHYFLKASKNKRNNRPIHVLSNRVRAALSRNESTTAYNKRVAPKGPVYHRTLRVTHGMRVRRTRYIITRVTLHTAAFLMYLNRRI